MSTQTQTEINKIRALLDNPNTNPNDKIDLAAKWSALEKRFKLETQLSGIKTATNFFYLIYVLVPLSFAYYYFSGTQTLDWPMFYFVRDGLILLVSLILHGVIAGKAGKIQKELAAIFPYSGNPTPTS